jgi:hypothetical protein
VQDDKSAFAQLTVRVRAVHKFAAYDRKQRLVAGHPEKEMPVQDVWVFERSFKDSPTSRWRVAGAANSSQRHHMGVDWHALSNAMLQPLKLQVLATK